MHVEPLRTLAELDEVIRAERRPGVARRLAAIRSAVLGDTAPDIAEGTGASERAVRGWVERYNAGGPVALVDAPGRGRKGPLGTDQQERLKARLRAGPTADDRVRALRGEDVRRILADEFGVVRSLAATHDLLHRLGFEPPRPRPRRRPTRSRWRSKKLPEVVGAVAAAHPDESVEVWFEDEAGFGQKGRWRGCGRTTGVARPRPSREGSGTSTCSVPCARRVGGRRGW